MGSSLPATAAVSRRLRARMAFEGIRQAAVAEALGISQPQVSARLRGEVAWTVDELAVVCGLLGVELGWVVAGGEAA